MTEQKSAIVRANRAKESRAARKVLALSMLACAAVALNSVLSPEAALGQSGTPPSPTISSIAITSTPSFDADGNGTAETYLWRDSIDVTVTWSSNVTWDVSAPGAELRLRLDVDGASNTTKVARLVTGGATSGTARSLVFRYSVVRRDRDTNGVYPKPSGNGNLVHLISGATLKDAHGQNASRAHGGLPANPNHQADGRENPTPPAEAPAKNAAPVITAPGDKGYEQGEAVTAFGITVTDADDDTLTVAVTGLPSGLSYANGQVQGTVSAAAPAQAHTVTISANDGVNPAVTATFTITVTEPPPPPPPPPPVPAPPTISSVAITSTPSLDADGDGTAETYLWRENIDVTVTWSSNVTWDVSAADAEIRLRLDVEGPSDTTKVARLVTGGATSGTARSLVFRYAVGRRDRDTTGVFPKPSGTGNLVHLISGATLKDSHGQNASRAHGGLSPDPNHQVDGRENPPSPTVAALMVADASAGEGDSITFTVTLDKAVSGGLTVTPSFTDGTATSGTDYTENVVALSFAGTANETQSFTVATIEDTEAEANETFTVSLTVTGTTTVVTATDTATGTITDDDTVNSPPVITDPGNKRYQRGETIRSFRIKAGDAEQDALTVTVTGLPPGLSYTGGEVQGTVAADAPPEAYTVTVAVDDGVNATVTETFTINIRARRARSTNDLTRQQ